VSRHQNSSDSPVQNIQNNGRQHSHSRAPQQLATVQPKSELEFNRSRRKLCPGGRDPVPKLSLDGIQKNESYSSPPLLKRDRDCSGRDQFLHGGDSKTNSRLPGIATQDYNKSSLSDKGRQRLGRGQLSNLDTKQEVVDLSRDLPPKRINQLQPLSSKVSMGAVGPDYASAALEAMSRVERMQSKAQRLPSLSMSSGGADASSSISKGVHKTGISDFNSGRISSMNRRLAPVSSTRPW